MRTGAADLALLPIENTTAGSINETYDLLAGASGALHITGEVVSAIEHCLLALPGVALAELRVVRSHPQALAQCHVLFAAHPHLVARADVDTAGSARIVAESGDRTLGAIASAAAAQRYGLAIVQRGVQSAAGNATRFVEISPRPAPVDASAPAKTSLLIELQDRPGALGDILVRFAARGLSLTKLESRPIASAPWTYRFYADVSGHAASAAVLAALDDVRPLTRELRVLGTYAAAAAAGEATACALFAATSSPVPRRCRSTSSPIRIRRRATSSSRSRLPKRQLPRHADHRAGSTSSSPRRRSRRAASSPARWSSSAMDRHGNSRSAIAWRRRCCTAATPSASRCRCCRSSGFRTIVSFEVGAATLLTYATTYHALVDRAAIQPGEALLVLGAAGGVGIAWRVEIGVLLGAEVIAVASSEDKLAFCRARTARPRRDRLLPREDVKKERRSRRSPAGAASMSSTIRSAARKPSLALRAIGWKGRYLVVGFASGEIPKIPLNLTLLEGLSVDRRRCSGARSRCASPPRIARTATRSSRTSRPASSYRRSLSTAGVAVHAPRIADAPSAASSGARSKARSWLVP